MHLRELLSGWGSPGFRGDEKSGKSDLKEWSVSDEAWRNEFAEAFRPVIRGMLLPAGIYYAIVFVLHFFVQKPEHTSVLAPLAASAGLTSLLFFWLLRKPGVTRTRLELYSLIVYTLFFANVLVHHLLHLEVTKLVYFVLLALVVATTGVTIRLIIPAIAISLAAAIWLAGTAGAEAQAQFTFITMATCFVAFGTSTLMRMAIIREIRSRLRTEKLHETAQYAADFDFLTGLPNRRSFFNRLEAAFADPAHGAQMVVGIIDLNGFKHVNDLHGHVFGDQLLARVAKRIQKTCVGSALVARLGGDEFAILLERPASDAVLREIGAGICAAVGRSYDISGTEVSVSAVIGFARRLATTSMPEQLYEQADFALYRGKRTGGGDVEIFTPEDEAELDAIKQVEHHLSQSRLEDEMFAEYQPMVLATEGRVTGFEALARWHSPHLGRVAPDIFIRAAERCGMMHRLTPVLLRKALNEAKNWPGDLRLSFNLSALDLISSDAVEQICQVVAQSGFPGTRIDFEITETAIMTDYERVRNSLARLRELGAHIALDDFGVGYSNFQHLDELAIDKLKIDRRFISRMGTETNSGRIAKTMIDMCTHLGLICVVEGVETADELTAVIGAGGAIVQGYHFSRPLTADKVLPFLSKGLDLRLDELRHSA